MLQVPGQAPQAHAPTGDPTGDPTEAPLNLRKRQTILVDRAPSARQQQPQRQPSRRASMHIRSRSINAPKPIEKDAPQFDVEDNLEAQTADELLRQMDALKLRSDELEQSDIAAVRRSYETLVSVSRSVAELPPQIAKLRKQVGDLAAITEALKADAEIEQDEQQLAVRSSVPRAPRASVLMLNSAWRQDLQALFRRVEGAQMFLPPIPGRHVVSDFGGYELNPVTWTQLKPVHLFVLSDHLLVAKKGRSLNVDYCWPLADVKIAKREDAMQVDSPQGLHIYRTKSLQSVLRDIKRAQVSLAPSASSSASASASASAHRRQPSEPAKRSSKIVAQEMELARVRARELADIDLKLAQHDWPRVTEAVLHSSIPGIEDRRAELEATLLKRAKAGGEPLALLVRLGRADEAMDLYLGERTHLIEQRVSEVSFRGDIVAYLSQVCVQYFQLIIATVRTFVQAFQAPAHSARVVAWTKQQIELYAAVFNRQLYKIRPSTRIYAQCVEVTQRESAQLRGLGLDMGFLLDYVWA